jgi:MoxR-like ATPase
MGLNAMAKAAAFIKGRSFVTPDDVIEMAPYTLAHRLILSPKGKGMFGTQEAAIRDILAGIPLPEGVILT